MSKTFNYTRAWHELALPMFNALPKDIQAGIIEIAAIVADLNQDKQLDIPLPKAVETLTAGWTDEEMSKASYASYFLGHWKPGIKEVVTGGRFKERIPAPVSPIPTSKGESWKVANVLDQILRKRLNLSRDNVIEGRIRVNCSTKDSWMWEDVDWATKENLERIGIGTVKHFTESSYYAALRRIQPINLTASFMEHEEGTSYTTEEQVEALQAAGITIDRRSCQKFDPHVPVIGTAAMEHSTGRYITGSAPCDKCGEPIDTHTSKYFLYVSDPDKAREVLASLKINLDKYSIELPPPEPAGKDKAA